MTVLVAYASKYGSTQGIAERIAEQLRHLGKPAEVRSMDDVSDPGSYEAFVLGSGLYAGSWLKEGREWVHRHQAVLAQHPAWLFSSGRNLATTCLTYIFPTHWTKTLFSLGVF